MVPGPEATAVQPSIAFFFTDDPPTATPVELTMGVMTIDIPPGDAAYRVTQTIELPAAVSLLALGPHAHYLGHQMLVTAKKPDGAVDRLLEIKHWNFHWQQEYRFVTPVPLPRGTSITMTYTFDNSDGERAQPVGAAKARAIRAAVGRRNGQPESAGAAGTGPRMRACSSSSSSSGIFRKWSQARSSPPRQDPANPARQWELGKAYVEVGRAADAIPPLEAAVRANPKFARAHDYLGRALFADAAAGRGVRTHPTGGHARSGRRTGAAGPGQDAGRQRPCPRRRCVHSIA